MCIYCERNGRGWEQMPPLPYREQDCKDGQSAVTGNMINPMTTIAVIHDYRSKQPELVVEDRSFFQKYYNDPTGIGTVYIPIKFCPECGRRLGKADRGTENVSGISDKLRNELRELYDSGCSLEDVINFTKRKRLSKKKSTAVLLQYYVWKAPEQCKGCENVWELPHCSCSRNHPDRYKQREKPSLPPVMIDDSAFICPI